MAALYIRLSKEDDNNGPSESVTNQRSMLCAYAEDQSISVYDIYIDDGFSGCRFDRPAFQRLLNDIEAGNINMVITKDLSRLGRDYIMTGHYLERYFPEHNVRYLSLLDGIDTGSNSAANDITPFRSILNDMYARDISRKITSVKRDKQRRGLFIGGKPVYGYRKHPTENNRIIIDEAVSPVVVRIFSMAISGMSCRRIAAILNDENIPSPSVYAHLASTGKWSGERIGEMLRNETYLGNMVQGKRVKISYKSKRSRRQTKDDWVIVEGTHEPIIDKESFAAAQRLLASRARTRQRTYDHPLKGLIICRECGCPLGIVNRKSAAGKDTLYFVCRTYQRCTTPHACSAHCVKVKDVTDLVCAKLREIVMRSCPEEKLFSLAQHHIDTAQINSEHSPPNRDTKITRINEQIDRIYSDFQTGTLMQDDFDRIYHSLCSARNKLTQEDESIKRDIPSTVPTLSPKEITDKFLISIENDRELITQLIEKIELTAEKRLIIYFRFTEEP